MEECMKTKYDTYIEERFFQRLETCIKEKELRDRIKVAWLNDKALYTDYSKTISFEFLHYSLHDESHSISILQYIYLLLGKRKIDKLSVGDLWLLLETAYSHDIGMSVSYEELIEIWDDRQQIMEILSTKNNLSDDSVYKVYEKLSKIIHKESVLEKNDNFIEQHPHWELEIRKAITFINSEYIRRNHPERSKNKVIDLIKNNSYLKIENRLYKIVGMIDHLHGLEFSEIEKSFSRKNIGFSTDSIHPRLVAMLLRIGDVLDIRNNRFDYWNINYLGKLPKDSEEHYQKHKSVSEFLVDEETVKININSDVLSVCKISRQWLDLIDQELQNLMRYWNDYAPRCLGGLRLNHIELEVKYKNQSFYLGDFQKELKTNPKKLMQLLTGENFYDTKLVVFREFLQNAVDATKMKIATELYNNRTYWKNQDLDSFRQIKPSEIEEKIFEDNQIEIDVIYLKEKKEICFKISDQGIGMDENGLDALFNIGKGWREREQIKKIFDFIPDWLVPTGGFGIGFLSAFLVCDHVKFTTKSMKEPQYIVDITSPSKGGYVDKIVNKNYYGHTGTTVEFNIPINKLLKEFKKYFKKEKKSLNDEKIKLDSLDITSSNDIEIIISKFLELFINNIFVDIIFPIKIKFNNNEVKIEDNKFWKISNDFSLNYNDYWDDEHKIAFRWRELPKENKVSNESQESKTRFAYKGISIDRNKVNNTQLDEILLILADKYLVSVDVFERNVDNVLEISRNSFSMNYKLSDILKSFFLKYTKEIIKNYQNQNKIDQEKDILNIDDLLLYSHIELKDYKSSEHLMKYNYLDGKELYDYFKISDTNRYIMMINTLLELIENNKHIVLDENLINERKDVFKQIYEQLQEIKNVDEKINTNKYLFNDDEKENIKICSNIYKQISDIFKAIDIQENELTDYVIKEKLEEIYKKLSASNKIHILKNDLPKESMSIIFLEKNKVLCTTFENKDQIINDILDDEIFKNKMFYFRNEKDMERACAFLDDCSKNGTVKKEIKKNKENLEYVEYSLNNTNKPKNVEKTKLVDHIKYKHENKQYSNRENINVDNIDITNFECLCIEDYLDFNLNSDKKIILNPFFYGKQYGKLNFSYLIDKSISEKVIKDIYNNSEIFNDLIDMTYILSDVKYSKYEIRQTYINLVIAVRKLEMDKKLEIGKKNE